MQPPQSTRELPAPDERLVAPGTRYEIVDGRVVYVPPADEPHGSRHAMLAAVIDAHRHDAYAVALDMLTRTSRIDDFAPDVSVYPLARDPQTGGRQLEELAFEIASAESLGYAGYRAAKLVERGVRRVFAIDMERDCALEWSSAIDAWSILDRRSEIVDVALAVPVPVEALLDTARADAAIARALRFQRHPEFIAEREEGRVEGLAEGLAEARARVRAQVFASAVLAVLTARGFAPTEDERRRVLAERDCNRLERWHVAAVTCASVSALLDD